MIDTVSRITADQVDRANASGRTPIVFIHGLWLLPHSWDRWAAVFEEAGYAPLTPGWPDDPENVDEVTSIRRCSLTRPSRRSLTITPMSSASSRPSRW